MERLKENLEKWSFVKDYEKVHDLRTVLHHIEDGYVFLDTGKVIGASVHFYNASEELASLISNKEAVKEDVRVLYEFREKLNECLKHLESIDFSGFDLWLNPNDIYEELPNGCEEGNEFVSLLNVYSDFIKENGFIHLEQKDIDLLINSYQDKDYVYVGKVISDNLEDFNFSLSGEIGMSIDETNKLLFEEFKYFYGCYCVVSMLTLKKID